MSEQNKGMTLHLDPNTALPAFLANEKKIVIEGMDKYQTTPRLYITQGLTKPETQALVGGQGGCVLMPDGIPVCKAGESFTFVAIAFFVTFEKWKDRRDTTTTKLVVDASRDPSSEIAKRALDKNLRNEDYENGQKGADGKPLQYRYVECLNFIFAIVDGQAQGSFALVTFSRGERYTGGKLVSMLQRRPASMFAYRVVAKPTVRQRNGNTWYGLDFNNPADGPYVTEDAFKHFTECNKGFMDKINAGDFVVNREEEDASDAAGNPGESGEDLPNL